MARLTLIGVPFQSGGRPVGVARGVGALRAAGFVRVLRNAGHDVLDAGDVVVLPPDSGRDPYSMVVAPARLSAMIRAVADAVTSALERERFPLVVGGDCPMLLGCVDAMRSRGNPGGLVHVDGHQDAYTPAQSPTGDAADSETAFVLGMAPISWDPQLAERQPWLARERLVMLGQRDAPDLARHGVASIAGEVLLLDDRAVLADPASSARAALDRLGGTPFWLHLDWDVLSNEQIGSVIFPRAGGLSWEALEVVVRALLGHPSCTGWDAGTYNPDLDPKGRDASRIVAFIAGVFNARADAPLG